MDLKHIEKEEIVIDKHGFHNVTPLLSDQGLELYTNLSGSDKIRNNRFLLQVVKELGSKVASGINHELVIMSAPKDYYTIDGFYDVCFSSDKDWQKIKRILEINISDVTDSMKLETLKNIIEKQDFVRKNWQRLVVEAV